MVALATGARLGLTAGAAVITFCAVVIAAIGVFIALAEVVSLVIPNEKEGKEE